MKKLLFLVSDEGWLFEKVVKACNSKLLNAEVLAVITNNPNGGCIKRAKNLNIPSIVVPTKGFSLDKYTSNIHESIKVFQPDFILLMFNRLLGEQIVANYTVVNLHLSLLPAFPGKNPREKLLVYGNKFSGATIHFIDEGVDTGPIIAQLSFPISDSLTIDDLYIIYGQYLPPFLLNTIDYLVTNRVKQIERKVYIEDAKYTSFQYSPELQNKFIDLQI